MPVNPPRPKQKTSPRRATPSLGPLAAGGLFQRPRFEDLAARLGRQTWQQQENNARLAAENVARLRARLGSQYQNLVGRIPNPQSAPFNPVPGSTREELMRVAPYLTGAGALTAVGAGAGLGLLAGGVAALANWAGGGVPSPGATSVARRGGGLPPAPVTQQDIYRRARAMPRFRQFGRTGNG